jgi:hypothetical protein
MERLIRPAIDGGVPYINQDFFNVLQGSNLQSYKSFLETINDAKFVGNNGIIIKGIKNVTQVGQQNTINFDLTNSMVYIDGDFLEPKQTLSQQSDYQIDSTKFWIVKYDEYEYREKKVSGFKNEAVLIKSYFDITTEQPPAGVSYIEVEIKNDKNYCSRYLDRILRYYMTDFHQIQQTVSTNYFDTLGKGFGEMFGFRICDGQDGTFDLRDKFLIGYATFSVDPTMDYTNKPNGDDLNNIQEQLIPISTNYGRVGYRGGQETVKLKGENLPPHNHGGVTSKADNKMRHSHEIQIGELIIQSYPPAQYLTSPRFARGKKFNPAIPYGYATKADSISEVIPVPAGAPENTFNTFSSNIWRYNKDINYNQGDIKIDGINYKAIRGSDNKWDHSQNGHLQFDSNNYYFGAGGEDSNGNNSIKQVENAGSLSITPIELDPNDRLENHRHDVDTSNTVTSPHNNLPPFVYIFNYEKINPYV